jgi:membrane fusion protein (multidrug efflux system)
MRRWWGTGAVLLLLIFIEGVPWLVTALTTVSTDDAFVNGHVTFVAPRVPGQVARVLVDDNNRVHTGDALVELDKEPYQVELEIAEAAEEASKADLVAAQAQVRGLEGLARSQRFNLARTNSTTRSPGCKPEWPRCKAGRQRSSRPKRITSGIGVW